MSNRAFLSRRHPQRRQSGAVLYIALIMLILLSLIGVIGLQIAGLQERMSSNYQATNMAFQSAEGLVRRRELDIDANVLAGDSPLTDIPPNDCGATFDPVTWTGAAPHVRQLDECFASGGVDMSAVPKEEKTDQIYQITVYGRDRGATDSTSEAVINTVYIP